MTVANNYAPVVTAANGVTTDFTGGWNAITAANLVVQLLNTTTGAYTLVNQGAGSTQYQVITLTSTGFLIRFNNAAIGAPSGNDVVISRNTAPAQPVPYTTSRGFQGSVEENSFDALTNMVQELTGSFSRAIQASVGDATTNLALPISTLRATHVLAFDASGNVIVSDLTLAQLEAGVVGPEGPQGIAGNGEPWVVAGGTADAIAVTYSPAVTTLPDGLILSFRATAANATTTPTFAPNGLTARAITQLGGQALVAGSIAGNNAEYLVRYNLANTRWELLNPSLGSGGSSVVLSTTVISSPVATVDIASNITSAYSHYRLKILGLAMDSALLQALVKQGGSIVTSAVYNFTTMTNASIGTNEGPAATKFTVANNINSSCPGVVLIDFFQPAIAQNLVLFSQGPGNAGNSTGTPISLFTMVGNVITSAATTGIRLQSSTGNINAAIIELIGVA